jgi:hypothetical protein
MAGVGIPELLLLLWPLLRRLDQRLDKQRVLGNPIIGQQDEKATHDSRHMRKNRRSMATLDYFGICTSVPDPDPSIIKQK